MLVFKNSMRKKKIKKKKNQESLSKENAHYFFTIVWVTASTPVPVASVVLVYHLLGRVIPIHRRTLHPALSTMPTHRVVYVNFPLLCFSFQPQQGLFGRAMFGIENILFLYLRFCHIHLWEKDSRLSFVACLAVPLHVTRSFESLMTILAFIYFCQLFNIFYQESMLFVYPYCHNVCQLLRRASYLPPYRLSSYAVGLIDTYSQPL